MHHERKVIHAGSFSATYKWKILPLPPIQSRRQSLPLRLSPGGLPSLIFSPSLSFVFISGMIGRVPRRSVSSSTERALSLLACVIGPCQTDLHSEFHR